MAARAASRSVVSPASAGASPSRVSARLRAGITGGPPTRSSTTARALDGPGGLRAIEGLSQPVRGAGSPASSRRRRDCAGLARAHLSRRQSLHDVRPTAAAAPADAGRGPELLRSGRQRRVRGRRQPLPERAQGAPGEGGLETEQGVQDGQAQPAGRALVEQGVDEGIEGLDHSRRVQPLQGPQPPPVAGRPARGRGRRRGGPPRGRRDARRRARGRASATAAARVLHQRQDPGKRAAIVETLQHLEGREPGGLRGVGQGGAERLDDPGPEERQPRHRRVALRRPVARELSDQLANALGAGWYDRH